MKRSADCADALDLGIASHDAPTAFLNNHEVRAKKFRTTWNGQEDVNLMQQQAYLQSSLKGGAAIQAAQNQQAQQAQQEAIQAAALAGQQRMASAAAAAALPVNQLGPQPAALAAQHGGFAYSMGIISAGQQTPVVTETGSRGITRRNSAPELWKLIAEQQQQQQQLQQQQQQQQRQW